MKNLKLGYFEDILVEYKGKLKQKKLVEMTLGLTFEELIIEVWPNYKKRQLQEAKRDLKKMKLNDLDVVILLEWYLKRRKK